MRYSIFTPSHDPRFLDHAYQSVVAQTTDDWEWVVLLNNGAEWEVPADDPWPDKIRVTRSVSGTTNVGGLKREAAGLCVGDILVELDHDDLLDSEALEKIGKAFEDNPEATLVYSDAAQILEDGEPDPSMFNLEHGWDYYGVPYGPDRTLLALKSMEPTPHNVSHIWYAPNHVRAFPRWAYFASGGYNGSLSVLDDQDLMARLYLLGPFVHIPECLYLQRTHRRNTQSDPVKNAFIQVETIAQYDRTIEQAALAWSLREGYYTVDLGSAHGKPPKYLGVDLLDGPEVDFVASALDLPFDDSSVGVVRAVDFLEHVPDKVALMEEIYRVLVPGGLLISSTPSTDGRGAFQDPTHVAFWNENSFWYWTDKDLAKYVDGIRAKFQVSRLVTHFPSPWHAEHNIPYVAANLIALKGQDTRDGGILRW